MCLQSVECVEKAMRQFAILYRNARNLLKSNIDVGASTGSPSSKYEHRRASALLRNFQNIRICMGKKPIVSPTYENERISIKNSLPYLKCVLRLSCVVHGPIYGRFVGFYVNGFLLYIESKDQWMEIISVVCHVNRAIYDAMQTVGNHVHILDWPYVDIGEDTVDPLCDVTVLEALKKVNMEHCCIKQWSFDFECETGCMPWHMVTNTMGQFLISQEVGKTVKVWDSNGMFQFSFNPQTDDPARRFYIWDIVTAEVDGKTYLLVDLPKTEAEKREVEVQVFNKTADVEYKFPVRDGSRLIISGSKLLVLKSREAFVYNQNGEFIRSFDIFDSKSNKCLNDCTATHDGRVLITHHVRDFRVYDCVHLFTVEGQQNATFKIFTPHTLFSSRPEGEHVIIASGNFKDGLIIIEIYTVNGKRVRRFLLSSECLSILSDITETMGRHIAVLINGPHNGKIFVF